MPDEQTVSASSYETKLHLQQRITSHLKHTLFELPTISNGVQRSVSLENSGQSLGSVLTCAGP